MTSWPWKKTQHEVKPENSATHRCMSPWGSSQLNYPPHLSPLFGAWWVPRVFKPHLTVRGCTSVPSQTLFGPVSHAGPPSFRVFFPRDASANGSGFLGGFPTSPTDRRLPHHLSPERGGGFVRRSGLTPPANDWARPGKQTLNRGAFVLGHVTPQRFKGKVQMRSCC